MTACQAGDNPQLVPLLDVYQAAVRRSGRHFHLLADKAYSHPRPDGSCDPGASATPFPERRDQKEIRAAKGSEGGRPPGFDQALYAEPNTIERGMGRTKHWRGVATRYDKYTRAYGVLGHIAGAHLFCS